MCFFRDAWFALGTSAVLLLATYYTCCLPAGVSPENSYVQLSPLVPQKVTILRYRTFKR